MTGSTRKGPVPPETPEPRSAAAYRRLAAETRERAAATDDLAKRHVLLTMTREYELLAAALDEEDPDGSAPPRRM